MKAIVTRERIAAKFSRDVAAVMSRDWDVISLEGVAGARFARPLLKAGKQRSTLALQASSAADTGSSHWLPSPKLRAPIGQPHRPGGSSVP